MPAVRAWAPGVCVEAPGVCVSTQAHGRGMGFSPDTTSHTHPQRAGEKTEEERGLLQLGCVTVGKRNLARVLSRRENELVF